MAFEEALFDKSGTVAGVVGPHEDDVTLWVGLGWFCVVMLGSALAAWLSLPVPDPPQGSASVDDIVHFEWLIVATFLAYPVRRCSQARVWLGLIAMTAASAQAFSVVDTAAERVETYDVAATAAGVWWAVPVFQLVCYTAFCVNGIRTRLAERRWQRLTAQLMRNPPPLRPLES